MPKVCGEGSLPSSEMRLEAHALSREASVRPEVTYQTLPWDLILLEGV